MKKNRHEQIRANLKGGQKKVKHPGNTPLTQPYTTPQAHHIAGAEARTEYNPTIRAAKQEAAGSRNRQKQIGEWYGTLHNQINEAAGATDASYGAANAAMLAHAAAGAQAAEATQGQILANNNATANLTGADPSLFAKANAEGAAGANQRQIADAALAAPIAQAGASQAAYLRNTGINATHEGISQRMNESKRRGKIREDLTALRKERSQKAVGNFNTIRQGEIDNQVKAQAFGLKKTEAAQGAAESAGKTAREIHREREEERRANAAQRNENQEQRNQNKKARNEGKGGGLTPSEQHDAQQGRKNAWSGAKSLYEKREWPSWAALETRLRKEGEISPADARWAVQRLRKQVENEQREEKRRTEDPNGASLGR